MIKLSLYVLTFLMTFGVNATVVRFETTVGDFDVELYEDEAPLTTENFLNYVNRGDYDDSVIHRSVPGFVIQGGGFKYRGSNQFDRVATDPPILNEAGISNTVGTLSMARTTQANSATSQWFINVDNNTNLDPSASNVGFAVFGKIVKGLDVAFLIESLARINFNNARPAGVFGELPVYRYVTGSIFDENLVKINRAYVLSDEFQINAGLSGSWYYPATSGQGMYFDVLPALDRMLVAWFTYDTFIPSDEIGADIGGAGQRWLTMEGGFDGDNVFNGILVLTKGGLFDNPEPVNSTAFGTASIEFVDCATASLSYDIPTLNLSGTIPLQRQTDVNVALCERLADENNSGLLTD